MNRIFVAAGTALAVVATAIGAAVLGATDAKAGGRGKSTVQNESDLVVTLVTPTLNQEVLPDLSDPGLNKVITVRFSSILRTRDFIDDRNVFNRLTPNVEFLDSTFLRLSGEPQIVGNVFRFDPLAKTATGTLPTGQYLLNIKSSVRNVKGNALNAGGQDFSSAFSVGVDQFRPVLRRASPINGQQGIGLNQRIVLTFNEPIDARTVLTTIQVQNASTNPPTAIAGKGGGSGVTLERNGFDVVFTPEPCFGYPPRTTIQMLVQARPIIGTTALATVNDVFGNQFTRDAGLQWSFNANTGDWVSPNGTFNDNTGIFKLQFVTKGITLPPVLQSPGSAQFSVPPPYTSLCVANCWFAPICKSVGLGIYYTTGNGVGQVDITNFYVLAQVGVFDYSQFAAVPNAPVRLGRITGMAVDPRWDSVSGGFHTFVYAADGRSASVLVLDSRSFKVIGRFSGFQSPADITVTTDFNRTTTVLGVVDTASSQLVMLDVQTISVNFIGFQVGAQSPCDAIKDNQKRRRTVAVGKGPTNVFSDSYLNHRMITCNTLDNSISVVDVPSAKLMKTHATASSPVEGDMSFFRFAALADIACISCQGGLRDPDGAVSVYVRAGARDGVEASFTDGVKNPTAVWATQQYADCSPTPNYGNSLPTQQWLVSNTGSDNVLDLRLNVQGGFGQIISVLPALDHKVGLNPTGAMFDSARPDGQSIWVACGGLGQFGGMDPATSTPAELKPVPGIRRIYNAHSH